MMLDIPTSSGCEICGDTRRIDQHHILHRKMGGSTDPLIHDHANVITLCRRCHTTLHEGPWLLERLPDGIRVVDKYTSEQVMRRRWNADLDLPALFHVLSLVDRSLTCLVQAVPFFSDEQLVEAFASAQTVGKRGWLIQAAILYEAQQRSIHGDATLAAIARRFEISLRQAQKYALVWKVFFKDARSGENGEEGSVSATPAENVNIDAIVLDDPSWYLVAASETPEPERWLAYAQDRKLEDARYTVAAFRRDIRRARAVDGWQPRKLSEDEPPAPCDGWGCPWIRTYCTRSGRPVPVDHCTDCDNGKKCETKPKEAVR
jgi:hypothetical protein